MPNFEAYADVDVDVDEFVSVCSKREIKELIEVLVEDGHLPKAAVIETKNSGMLQTEFLGKMNNLVDNYYRISKEDEEILENLFKKYL